MPQPIPLRSDLPFFDLQASLDGATYTLQFRWSVRAARWFMQVLDEQAENVLVGDMPLVTGLPLATYRAGTDPRGWFVVVDTTGHGQPPGISDLGTRTLLLYYTQSELAEMASQ